MLVSWWMSLIIVYISEVCSECSDDGLRRVRDMYIVENKQTARMDDTRPFYTLPSGLSIKKSSIPGAGLGVFAERDFPKGTRFGPYTGEITDNVTGDNWIYSWHVYDLNARLKHYIDGSQKNVSNWLRYINCPRTVDEENLYLFQFNDEIYYVTYECIKRGTELLIWYGPGYGTELGLERKSEDYQRRFNEPEVKYIIASSLYDNVYRIHRRCYKFFNTPPFVKPPGRVGNFDRYCFDDDGYQTCQYQRCLRNPCTKKMDCQQCNGYCLHLGRYIKTNEKFSHADNTNTCICHEDGHFGCTINPQSIEQICG